MKILLLELCKVIVDDLQGFKNSFNGEIVLNRITGLLSV